ncbi:MAG: enoyl-CoA hydratase/isomerase family protein [Candidatus Jordarchaeaceae archaeon]
MIGITFKYILLEKDDGTAIIRMNQPEKLNAMRIEMQEEMVQALNSLALDDSIKVVIITGWAKPSVLEGTWGIWKWRTERLPSNSEKL